MRRAFDTACFIAAYSLLVAAALLAIEYTVLGVGINKIGSYQRGCFLDQLGFTCQGFRGASVVNFILNIPVMVLVVAAVALYAVVSFVTTFSIPGIERTPLGYMLVIVGVSVWLVLGVIGLWRMMAGTLRGFSKRVREKPLEP